MPETTLPEKRAELQRLLATGHYTTLIDQVLDRAGRAVQRLARRPTPPSFWYSAALICLLIFIPGAALSVLLGEHRALPRQVVSIVLLGTALAYATLVIFKLFIRAVFASLRDDILDAVTSPASLADLQGWLELLCSVKPHLVFSLLYGLVLGGYTAHALSVAHQGVVGYGLFLAICLVACIWGLPMYLLFIFLILPLRLSRYDYHLFKADPRSSEVIAHLSRLLAGLVYVYALVAAGSMLFLAFAELLVPLAAISILVAWLPITLLFAAGQYALARIITRAKWSTLNQLQARIERIQAHEDLAEEETIDQLNRLLDYHDRIRDTRNSTLDLRAALAFLNSLLLPVAGFVLGNLERLQGLF